MQICSFYAMHMREQALKDTIKVSQSRKFAFLCTLTGGGIFRHQYYNPQDIIRTINRQGPCQTRFFAIVAKSI